MPGVGGVELPVLVFFLAAVPFLESRFAIPYAIGSGLAPNLAILLGIAGNLVQVPVSLLLVVALQYFRRHWAFLDRVMNKLDQRARNQSKTVKRLGWVGLVLLVGIPIPGTGIWTGLLVAQLLGMSLRTTAMAISLGVVCAGLVVGAASAGVFSLMALGN